MISPSSDHRYTIFDSSSIVDYSDDQTHKEIISDRPWICKQAKVDNIHQALKAKLVRKWAENGADVQFCFGLYD
ncbi:hypothetical protein CRYUN_Cryun38cG0016700 [Craigia yunnanensis]